MGPVGDFLEKSIEAIFPIRGTRVHSTNQWQSIDPSLSSRLGFRTLNLGVEKRTIHMDPKRDTCGPYAKFQNAAI